MLPVTIKVRDVMDRNVIRVAENATAFEVIKRMLDSEVWSVVIEERQLPVGVVTERDVLRRAIGKGLNLEKVNASEIMSSPIITIDPDASLGEAMKMMTDRNVRRLFVLENGKIIGRITQTELFQSNLDLMLTLSSMRYTI